MVKYLWPLITFVVLNLVLLIIAVLMPALGGAGDQLAANTADYADVFWGWSWMSGGVRLLVWVFVELIILFIVAVEYLAIKKR